MMRFLGWYQLLDVHHVQMGWSHSIQKTECFVHTVFKVIVDPFTVLNRELIQYILDLIVAIPLNLYVANIVDLILQCCSKCLYRCWLEMNNHSNCKTKEVCMAAVPQKVVQRDYRLQLLRRAMQRRMMTKSLKIW